MFTKRIQGVVGAGLLVLCGIAAGRQEPQGVPRVLIDRKLQERSIQLIGIDTRTITYLDIAGLVRHEPITEFLVLAPLSPADMARRAPQLQSTAEQATSGPDGRVTSPAVSTSTLPTRPVSLLELADGERFSGVLAPPGASAKDSVRWAHPVLGVIEFKLDQLRRILLNTPAVRAQEQPVLAPPAQDDVVIFANGDRVEGLVESIGGAGEKLGFSTGKGEVRAIELAVVREVVFANPPQAMPARSMVLWLRDGSVISCRGIQTNRVGELQISPTLRDTESTPSESSTGAPGLRLDDLLGVAFDSEELVALATIAPLRQAPESDRRWASPPVVLEADRAVLGAADIQIPGPMTIEWDLPAGVSRFATEAELPRAMWTWGDCELVVSAVAAEGGESEVFRRRINAEQPRAKVSIVLGEPTVPKHLRIKLEPGANGPIQDQVVLRRPLLLVEKKPG